MSTESLRLRVAPLIDRLFEFLSRRRVMIFLTVFPAILLFSVITLMPMGWSFIAGFYDIPLFSPEWEFIGLQNYTEILSEPEFFQSIWNGIIFAGLTILIQLVLGIGLAILINRRFPFETVVRGIVFLPYLFPTTILGFIALWMMDSTYGIINQIFFQLGLISQYIGWFGREEFAMAALIGTHSWKYTIFVSIMVLARLQSIPDSHYEAATVAGASLSQQFRDITLPNLKGVIFIVLLLRGIWNFNKFDIIWVLTRGGPNEATFTAPVYAYNIAFGSGNQLGKAAAASSLLFLILIAVAIVYFVVLEPEQEVRVE